MPSLLILFFGAVLGAGVLIAAMLVVQPRTSGPVALAQFDEQLRRGRRSADLTADRRHQRESQRMRQLGSRLVHVMEARGFALPRSWSAQLGLVGMSREVFLARCLTWGAVGALWPVMIFLPVTLLGYVSPTLPLWLTFVGVAVGVVIPISQLRQKSELRLRAFRHVLSAFLDLVSMNLAGGRGVPEALQSAASVSDGWAMVRIRDTLEAARLQGVTPWAALGRLGDEIDLEELRDLSAALGLVAEDGAKVRESLSARAASMRAKELADAEGRAAARSQSMLLAQLLMCLGFLIFLIYPALATVMV